MTLISTDTPQPLKGNTKTFRGRHFLMTINERTIPYTMMIVDYINHWKTVNYILITEHIGQENKHYHLYCQFTNPINMNSEYTCGAHIEQSFGSPEQNYKYCMCEDDKHKEENIKAVKIYEQGEIRKTYSQYTIADIKKMEDSEIDDLPYKYFNTIQK